MDIADPQPYVYAPDAPAVPPRFDFDLVGTALSEILIQPTDGATVLGIHGPWGSGKTTLMWAVRDALETTLGDSLLITIEFNAWKYRGREALWRALILRVVGELRARDGDVAHLDELESALYEAFEVDEAGPWSINWRAAATEVAYVALEVLQVAPVGKLLRRIVGGKPKADADAGIVGTEDIERLGGVLERETLHRRVAKVESIEQFLNVYREVITTLGESGHRVVVLVDDLDRCLPDAALEIFEAIKLFLDAPGCGFVVAVDRDVIKKGLALRYPSADHETAVIDVDEYVEKTIALSFDVPRLSGSDIDCLIEDANLGLELRAEHRALLLAGLGPNPRRVKRFLNALALQISLDRLARTRGSSGLVPLEPGADPEQLGVLLKVMLIGYRHSGVMRAASVDPWLLRFLQAASNAYESSSSGGRKQARNETLSTYPEAVRALQHQPEFWALMATGPDLVQHEAAVKVLLSWFRQSNAP